MSTEPRYQIRVRGHLDPHWADWFGDMSISHETDGDTMLIGPVADRAALFGLLARIRDLGLTLLAVKCIEEYRPDGEG